MSDNKNVSSSMTAGRQNLTVSGVRQTRAKSGTPLIQVFVENDSGGAFPVNFTRDIRGGLFLASLCKACGVDGHDYEAALEVVGRQVVGNVYRNPHGYWECHCWERVGQPSERKPRSEWDAEDLETLF